MYVKTHGAIPTGQVALTGPGKLRCKYIIHAVGPVWKDGLHNEKELLGEACLNSIKKANSL